MRPRLVSLNFGMTLVIQNGEGEQQIRFSGRCPSRSFPSVQAALESMIQNINEEFETHYFLDSGDYKDKVTIAKPKRVDSASRIDQEQFVRELVG